jgi:membrane associated rhomboid family serine protease
LARHKKEGEAKAIAVQETHKPYFIILVTVIDLALMIFEIVYNGGFEAFKYNPWLGPSLSTLVDIGAKDANRILAGEWWRFFTPIFLHVGVVHIFMNLLMQLRVGRSLEQSYGAMRIAPIYILCGIYGNILSCIFLPTQVQVGASGALFGFLGVLLSDLIQNWSLLQTPGRNLFSLSITIIISLAIGLLPGGM